MSRGDRTPRELEVLDGGPMTTIQDQGRPGLAHLGVGPSGAADRSAAALANRLVANRPDAALLEATLGGLWLRAGSACTLALSGADPRAELDGQPVGVAQPLAVPAGGVLRLGAPAAGLRTYVAVRGGIDVPPVLGSRSRDTLAGLGPPPLRSGDLLPVGPPRRRWPLVDHAPLPPWAGSPVRLRLLRGPHQDVLDAASWRRLSASLWLVGADSDRVGVRLDGPLLGSPGGASWPPEGLVRGAVQLPPGGQLVVMLADHPVTGGYPVIACLDDASADRLAQVRPGDRVRLDVAGQVAAGPGRS